MSDHKASVIDGKAIAQTIRSEIATEVQRLSKTYSKVPGLAVVIVGQRKDSQSYVNMKRKACAEVGIKSIDLDLPENVSETDLICKVHELNANPDVHGILVQLPLPKHINEEKILTEISLTKDVDGFHPLNIGKLAMKGRDPLFVPCTPKGCIELLHRQGVTIKGKNAVVVGRSNIVGLPVSLLLLKEDATVTVVHSRTKDPDTIIRNADIIIAAAGQAAMIKGSWIKPGAAVIDVGTNAVDDPTKKSGYRLVGDVDFPEACTVAGCITPVPGGVGPMTVAMLLKNTLDGAKRVIEGEDQPSKKNKLVVKTSWRVKEDIALMSAWIYVSENAIRGKNRKTTLIWNKIEIHYDASQAENPKEIGVRNVNQMKGRWKRLNENASKWVSACREALRGKKSGMSQGDLEANAHKIYEENNGGKYTDLVVFNEVMCKIPKWDPFAPDYGVKHGRSEPVDGSTEESGGSSKRTRTSEDVEYANPIDPNTPGSTCSMISRPTDMDKAKKKGKGKASTSYDEMAVSITKLALTRELENETNKMRLEVEREKMQMKMKMEKIKMKQMLLNSLFNKPQLTLAEEQLKEKLINELFG